MNHFDLLGVSPDASHEEIATAYRLRAQQLHPDTKPDASPAEKARLTTAMAEVNAAWSTLRDPSQRAAYLEHLYDPVDEPIVIRAPAPDECVMCGSYPAVEVRFQHQRAWLISATVWTTEARLCRGCGLAIGRSSQNRTLWTGWFGIIAFFRNFAIALTNADAIHRVGRLAAPKHRREVIFAPFERALDGGKPMWQRSGTIFIALVIAGIGIASALSEPEPEPEPPPRTAATVGGDTTPVEGEPSARPATWRVGSCVSGSFMVEPVSCAGRNDGEIIARATTSFGCPTNARSYVEESDGVWCIR